MSLKLPPMPADLTILITETVQKAVDLINDKVNEDAKVIRIFQPVLDSKQVLLICVDDYHNQVFTPEMILSDNIRILNDTWTLLPREGLLDHFITHGGATPYRQALRDMTEDVYDLIDSTQPIDRNTSGNWFVMQPYIHDLNKGHMMTAEIEWSDENLTLQYGLTQHSYVLPLINDRGALNGL